MLFCNARSSDGEQGYSLVHPQTPERVCFCDVASIILWALAGGTVVGGGGADVRSAGGLPHARRGGKACRMLATSCDAV